MRRFFSYGPVIEKLHFAVARKELVASCLESLVGDAEEGGHYFTIWASRQTGKTWLMRQVKKEIEARHKERFAVHCCSLGRLRGMVYKGPEQPDTLNLPQGFAQVLEDELPGNPILRTWQDFYRVFTREFGIWDRPLILLIDEVDSIPPLLMDIMVNQFRELYIDREKNLLHGLALVGITAVLGVESERGSPFNIQRSMRVPNFTREEVADLFLQYQAESGQIVEREVVDRVFETTCGQPGLVGWFGELLSVQDLCVVSPEFTTGNGRVDLHVKCAGKTGIIEVKSFRNMVKAEYAKQQAAEYARKLRQSQVMLAMFVPVDDEEILREMSNETVIDGVRVMVSAIGRN